jgi:hypothetical protein
MSTDSSPETCTASASPTGTRGKVCPNCESPDSWGKSLWCPECGWYPALNRCIDMGDDCSGDDEAPARWQTEEPAGLLQAIPLWGWACLGGVLLVAGLTVAAGQMLPAAGTERMLWTLLQMALGALVAGAAHVVTFFVSIQKTDRISPFDVFMRPIEIWKLTFPHLPRGAWRVCLAAWGLTAFILAPIAVGGVNWMGIFEGGPAATKAPNALQAAVSEARKDRKGGADDLEGAVKDFTGEGEEGGTSSGGDGEQGKDGKDADGKKDEENEDSQADVERPLTEDCLIVGYTATGEDRLDTLILAAAVKNQIRFVGRISADDVPAATRNQLLARMRQLRRKTPFVSAPYEAEWLKPLMMVRVRFAKWSGGHRMVDPVFDAMLRDVR